jgi:magnesium-transporting ATPase (P-type)
MVAHTVAFQDRGVPPEHPARSGVGEQTGTSPPLRAVRLWLAGAEFDVGSTSAGDDVRSLLLASVAAGCVDGASPGDPQADGLQDPVDRAALDLAALLGVTVDPVARDAGRLASFRAGSASPHHVTTVDACRNGPTVTMRGGVESVLPCCSHLLDDQGRGVPLTPDERSRLRRASSRYAAQGLQVVAVAHRAIGVGQPAPRDQQDAETELVLIGLVAFAPLDAPVGPGTAAADPVAALIAGRPGT